jgi:hypothetical protein
LVVGDAIRTGFHPDNEDLIAALAEKRRDGGMRGGH